MLPNYKLLLVLCLIILDQGDFVFGAKAKSKSKTKPKDKDKDKDNTSTKKIVSRTDVNLELVQKNPPYDAKYNFSGPCAPKLNDPVHCFYSDTFEFTVKCCKADDVLQVFGSEECDFEKKYPLDTICEFDIPEITEKLTTPTTKLPVKSTVTTKIKQMTTTPSKITTRTPTNGSTTRLKCHSCEASGGTSLACKDNPKSTKIVICEEGHHCRTVSYVSPSRGSSVLIRGCVDPNNVKSLNRKKSKKMGKCHQNPSYLPKICDDCSHVTCDCICNKNLCNNRRYGGQGWDACIDEK